MATTGASAAQTIVVAGEAAAGVPPTTALLAGALQALAVSETGTVTALLVSLGDAWIGKSAALVE